MRNMSRLCRKVGFPNIIVGKRDGDRLCVCRRLKERPDFKGRNAPARFEIYSYIHVIKLHSENDVRYQIAVGKLKIFKNRKIVYISKMLLLITYVAMPRYPIHTYIIL